MQIELIMDLTAPGRLNTEEAFMARSERILSRLAGSVLRFSHLDAGRPSKPALFVSLTSGDALMTQQTVFVLCALLGLESVEMSVPQHNTGRWVGPRAASRGLFDVQDFARRAHPEMIQVAA